MSDALSEMRDELKLYHESIAQQIRTEMQNGTQILTPGTLLHFLEQAWGEVEHDRDQRSDAWLRRRGLHPDQRKPK